MTATPTALAALIATGKIAATALPMLESVEVDTLEAAAPAAPPASMLEATGGKSGAGSDMFEAVKVGVSNVGAKSDVIGVSIVALRSISGSVSEKLSVRSSWPKPAFCRNSA